MALVTGTVLYRDASITIDDEEYANAITRARLVPETPVIKLQTLDPTSQPTHRDTANWTFELTGVQVWATGGITKALHDAAVAGVAIEVVLTPQKGTGMPTATFDIMPVFQAMGGDRGQILQNENGFEVVGQPVFGVVAGP